MNVMTWTKFKKQNNLDVDWSKDYFGFEYYGNFYREGGDSRSLDDVVKDWVKDKAAADERNISAVVYTWKRKGWEKPTYEVQIYVKSLTPQN